MAEETPPVIRSRDEQDRVDIQAAELRGQRLTYREIADHMKCDVRTAYDRVQRAMSNGLVDDPAVSRQLERERLDRMYRTAEKVSKATHYAMAHGKVVHHPVTGDPLLDPTVNLAAVREMRQVAESLRKLDGLDAPTRVEQNSTTEFRIVGIDPNDLV